MWIGFALPTSAYAGKPGHAPKTRAPKAAHVRIYMHTDPCAEAPMDDNSLFLCCWTIIVALWVIFICNCVSDTITVVLRYVVGVGGNGASVSTLNSHATSLLQAATYYGFSVVSSVVTFFLWSIPLLIFIFLLDLVYMQASSGLAEIIASYNVFFSQTSVFMGVQYTVRFGRLWAEIAIPLLNFVVDFLRSLPIETIRLLVLGDSGAASTGALYNLTVGMANVIVQVVTGLGQWLHREVYTCTPSAVLEDIARSGLSTHACLDPLARTVDLGATNSGWSLVSQGMVGVVTQLCPAAGSVVSLVLAPLSNPLTAQLMEQAANSVLALGVTTWRVTALRCTIVLRDPTTDASRSTALCIPDMAPAFVLLRRTLMTLGRVLDDWSEVAYTYTLSLFVERDASNSCGTAVGTLSAHTAAQMTDVDANLIPYVSGTSTTTTVSAAVAGATAVRFVRGYESTEVTLQNATLDPRHGVVAVKYSLNAESASVMGCHCTDVQGKGPSIACPVVLESARDDEATPMVPVFFSDTTPAARAAVVCADLYISVQPLQFKAAARSTTAERAVSSGVSCALDPAACSDIDALVYVSLACGTHTGVGCFTGSVRNLCYPYCIGLHQAAAGPRPIYLSNAAVFLSGGGRLLLNLKCANTERSEAVSGETLLVQTGTASGQTFEQRAGSDMARLCTPALFATTRMGALPSVAEEEKQAFADGQPFLYAGPYIVTEAATVLDATAGRGSYVSIEQLAFTTGNAAVVETALTRVFVPTEFLPQRERPRAQRADLAAATLRGVLFYALNPSVDVQQANLQGQAGYTFRTTDSLRLVRFAPLDACSRAPTVDDRTSRYCDASVLHTVPGFPPAPLPRDGTAFRAAVMDHRQTFDLRISSVVAYDARNIVVVVRHGPAAALAREIGIKSEAGVPLDLPVATHFYFIDTESPAEAVRFQRDRPFMDADLQTSGVSVCSEDRRVPPFFSVFVATIAIPLEGVKVVVNDYVVNGIGLAVDVLGNRRACAGNSWQHLAYDGCSSTRPRPYSLMPLFTAMVELDSMVRVFVEKSSRFLRDIFFADDATPDDFLRAVGFASTADASNARVLAVGILRLATTDSAATLLRLSVSCIGLVLKTWPVVFDLYVLPVSEYVVRALATSTFTPTNFWNVGMRVHYDAVNGGTLEGAAFVPMERTCFVFADLAWDRTNPLGRMLQRGCQTVVESSRVLLRASAYLFTVPQVNLCLCSTAATLGGSIDLPEAQRALDTTCPHAIPDVLLEEYVNLIVQRDRAACTRVVGATRATLFGMPGRLARLYSLFSDATADTVAFLPSLLNVSGLSYSECARPDRSLDGGILLPQPLVSFMGCGMTPTCRVKCATEIGWFEDMQAARVSYESSYTQVLNETYLATWAPQAGPSFQPLLVQTYVQQGTSPCMYHYTVIARSLKPDSNSRVLTADWDLRSYCMMTSGADLLQLEARVQLPGTAPWKVAYDFRGAREAAAQRVDLLAMLPRVFDYTQQARRHFLGGVLVQLHDTRTADDIVHLMTIPTDGARVDHRVLFRASDVLLRADMVPPHLLNAHLVEECAPLPSGEAWDMGSVALLMDEYAPRFLHSYTFFASEDPVDVSFFFGTEMHWAVRQEDQNCLLRSHLLARIQPDPAHTTPVAVQVSGRNLFAGTTRTASTLVLGSSEHPNHDVYVANTYEWCRYRINDMFFVHNMSSTKRECYRDAGVSRATRLAGSPSYAVSTTLMRNKTLGNAYVLVRAALDSSSRKIFWARSLQATLGEGIVRLTEVPGTVVPLQVTHKQQCTYMSCNACEDADTRVLCQAAQDCVVMECLGTRVSAGSWFCSLGLLLRGQATRRLDELVMAWHLFAETVTLGVEAGSLQMGLTEIKIEAISNAVLTEVCQAKDMTAVLSTVLPTFFMTLSNAANNVRMSDFTLDPASSAYAAMSRVVSPTLKLAEIQYVMAASQMINQVLLGYVQFVYATSRILMCSARSLNSLSGGLFEIIDYDFNVENDVCSIMLPTLDYIDEDLATRVERLYSNVRATGTTAVEVRDTRGNVLASDGGSIAVDVLQTITTVGISSWNLRDANTDFDKQKEKLKTQLGASGADARSRKRRGRLDDGEQVLPDRRFVLFYLSAILDWVVGCLYGAAGLARLTESQCAIKPAFMAEVTQCACGDKGAYIPADQQQALLDTDPPPLWCMGVLRMVDRDGAVVYINNPLSYAMLVARYEAPGERYLECVASSGFDSAECQAQADALHATMREWGRVSPLAVLSRCRENYAARRWDPGLFAALHAGTRAMVLAHRDVSEATLTNLEARVRGLDRPEVAVCLAQGEEVNSIESCTAAFFRDTGGATFDVSGRAAYFSYANRDFSGARATPDACRFLSQPDLVAAWGADMGSQLQQCQASMGTRGVFDNTTCAFANRACPVSLSTVSLANGRRTNALGLFNNDDEGTVDDAAYENLASCARGQIAVLWAEKEQQFSEENLAKYDFSFVSFEGDNLHSFVDCMVQGGYASVPILPADPSGRLENLTYQAPYNTSQCTPASIFDSQDPEGMRIASHTCGSATRAGVVNMLLKGLDSTATALIRKRLIRIFTRDIPDALVLHNLHRDCAEDGECTPEIDFGTTYTVQEAIQGQSVLLNIRQQTTALVRFQTEALNTSLIMYPTERVALHSAQVSYPVHGALRGDAAEFAFPLTRAVDGGTSIQAQCEGLLRTRVWSHPTAARGDLLTLAALNALFGSAASGHAWESAGTTRPEMGRELVHDKLARGLAERSPAPRFSASEWAGFGITDLALDHVVWAGDGYWRPVAAVDSGPWHPLAREGHAPSGAANFSRAHVVQALVDYTHIERWWEGLYDARIVPSASQFCTDRPAPDTASPSYSTANIKAELQKIFHSSLGYDVHDVLERSDMDKNVDWVNWGPQDRTVGAMHAACPCVPAGDDNPATVGSCLISRVVCDELEDGGLLPHGLRDACSVLDVQDTTQVVAYPDHEAGLVREALRVHGPVDMPCSTFEPSSLWGIAEGYERDLLWHGASGVTMRNMRHVSENLWRHVGESDRKLRTSSADGAATLGVPGCDTRNSSQVEAEAFPAVHVVPESPALLACARYVLEGVWEQALRVHGVTGLEMTHAEEARALWRERCTAKIDKLRSCQELGAFGATVPASDPTDACPFSVDPDEGELRLLRHACLIIDLLSPDRPLYDPFACRTVLGPDINAVLITRTWLDFSCRVADPQEMLAGDAQGLADAPGLSVAFAEGVLAVGAQTDDQATAKAVRAYLFPEGGADYTRWFDRGEYAAEGEDRTGALTALGDKLARSVDAERFGTTVDLTDEEAMHLVPENVASVLGASDYIRAGGRYWQPAARLAANETVPRGAHFRSAPYWPQHWQYPLGEALTEHPEYMAGFANYMAIVDGEVTVASGLARALYADEPSAQFYGTTGQCREHTVGMPLKDINTHRLCTSASTDTVGASCSASAAADAGGGYGPVLGPLFQVARLWLSTDGFQQSVNTPEYTYAEFLQHSGATDHARDTSGGGPSSLAILREQCNMDPEHFRRSVAAMGAVPGAPAVECNRTSDCAVQRGEVCHAGGTCGTIEVIVRNDDESDVEFGVVSPACDASPAVSGASPWKRARHYLAQHGMCAHRHAVTYERMLLALAAPNNTRQACTLRTTTTTDALGLEWVEVGQNETVRNLEDVYKGGQVERLRQHIGDPVKQKMSLATWLSFGINDLRPGDYVRLETNAAPYMIPVGNRTFEYFECQRNATEWDWVRENPGWWGKRSAALDQTTAEMVGELGEFDLDPHACDYEPLHAQDWGWCNVAHREGPVAADDARYTHWMRLAASHDNFTVMRDEADPANDISRDNFAWNKLRFLGLEREALLPLVDPESRPQAVRVTQCQNFGVCESGDFTVGGVRGSFHRFFVDHAENASRFYQMDNVELCGPMGVHRGGTDCELDPAVTTLFHVVHDETREASPCRDIFEKMRVTTRGQGVSSILEYDTATSRWKYATTQRESVRAILNRFFALDFGLEARQTNANLHKALSLCAEDLVKVQLAPGSSLQQLIAEKERTKYDLHENKTAGMYIFLDFIALEVPVFWWLKFALERIFFVRQSSEDVFVLDRATMATPWFDAERLADQKMEIPLASYKNRGKLDPGLSVRGLWASVNSVATYPLVAVKNVFFATMARWLYSKIGNKVKFGRYANLVLPERSMLTERQSQSFMRCFERTVFGTTSAPAFTDVCVSGESNPQRVADLSMAEQFLHPVVSSRNSAGETMFMALDDTDIYTPDGVEGIDNPIIKLYRNLFQSIFEQMTPAEKREALLAFNPYTEEGLQTPDIVPGQQNLPLLRFEMPRGSLWVNYLESALEPALTSLIDEMDAEYEDGFKPPGPGVSPGDVSECLFSREEPQSMKQRAVLEYGDVDLDWLDTEYKHSKGSISFNLCEANPQVQRGRLQPVHTSMTTRGPTCGLGLSTGFGADLRQYQGFPVSDRDQTMFVHRLGDGAESELKSKMTSSFCGDDYTCCPDDLVLANLTDKILTSVSHEDLYFGSVYTDSHTHYVQKTEQNDADRRRCIRTDSSCFLGPSENTWNHISGMWKNWRLGEESVCAKDVKIQSPPEFRVHFFRRNSKMRYNEVVYNDRVVMDQPRSAGGRRFLSLMHTGTETIPVLPTPAASFCPAGDDADENYAMHQFMPLELLNVREHYRAFQNDKTASERIDANDEFYKSYPKWDTQYTGDDRRNMRINKDEWLGFNHVTGEFFPFAKKYRFEGQPYEYHGTISKHSAACEASDAELDQSEYCKYTREMHTMREKKLICNPAGSGALWGPDNVKTSLYEFGKCYDDDILGQSISENMLTACEYLSHVFSEKYVDYFMFHFMGADQGIKETRTTELFEPLDTTIKSLKVRAGVELSKKNAIHGEISAARFREFTADKGRVSVIGTVEATWRKFCKERGISDLCRGDLDTMMPRHRMTSYLWGKNKVHAAPQEVSQWHTQRDRKNLDAKRISPCIPRRTYPDIYNADGRLYGACHGWVFSGVPDDAFEEKCWEKCGEIEGECNDYCGDGACCREDFGSLNSDEPQNSGSICQVARFRDCDILTCPNFGIPSHLCRGVLETQNMPRTCLPAVDTAMDVLDTQGFCRGGGSRTQLNVVPHQWQRISDILTNDVTVDTKIWVPCPPECDGNMAGPLCTTCESVFVRESSGENVGDMDDITGNARKMHTIDEACSFEIEMDSKFICGRNVQEAGSTCDNSRSSESAYDVFTRYNTVRNSRPVAWKCEPCHVYSTTTAQTFAVTNAKNKLGYGVFHGTDFVHKDSDALGRLRDTIQDAMDDAGTPGDTGNLTLHLSESIAEQNELNAQNGESLPEGSHAPMHLSLDENLVVYHKLSELQDINGGLALPDVLTGAFREFGSAESLSLSTQGCAPIPEEDDHRQTRCARLMQTEFRTHDAHAKSAMLQQALLQGCRVEEDSPIFNEHKCTPHITHADTRYNRLRAFQRDVLSRQFGLALPIVPTAAAAALDVEGVDWTRGMLPFYARAERDRLDSGDVYLDHVFNDADNCWNMYESDSSFRGIPVSIQDMPCFEDFNKSVHLLNPWLGGNYSFPRHLTNFYDYLGLEGDDDQLSRVAAGFDLCLRGQTLQGGNVQPCQAHTCIAEQNAENLHPDDENRTVCKWSTDLNLAYNTHEFFNIMQEQIADDFGDNLGIIYAAPTTRTPCDKQYRAGGTCRHTQALLGFAPGDRGRMQAAPSLNRTGRFVDGKMHRDVFSMHTDAYNLSQSLWAGERFGVHRQGYGALAMDPADLAPARVELRVDGTARNLLVHTVAWHRAAGPDANWIRTTHARHIGEDRDRLDENPLYHARVRNSTHWSCPLLVREALTGSAKLHALHPETHLLAPDPLQAARLYPGLGGLHPAYRLTPVQRDNLAHYRMVGLRDLRHAGTLSATVTLQDARRLLEDALDTQRGQLRVQRHNSRETQCLRWPHTHAGGTLRSGEDVGNLSACAPGALTDLGSVIDNRTQIWIDATASMTSGTRLGPASAGVCYRAPLAKMSRAQWDAVQGDASSFLKCRRIDQGLGNATRTIRCWTGGTEPPTDFVLETTDVRGVSPGAFRRDLEHPRAMPSPRHATHADEVSVGVRRRISPLRARMRRAGLAHLEPGALWARAAPLVARAPVPADNRSAATFDRTWGGRDCTGVPFTSMPYRDWVDADTRADRCYEMLDKGQNLSCASQSVDLDLCQLSEMRPVCEYLTEIRRRAGRLNARKAGFLRSSAHYYTPSTFHHDDGEFASRAVAAHYNSLGIEKCDGWFDKTLELGTDTPELCSENIITAVIERLRYLRQVLLTIVDLFFVVSELMGNVLLCIALQIASAAAPGTEILAAMANQIAQDVLNGFIEIGELLLEYIGDLGVAVVQFLLRTFADWIEAAIQGFCYLTELIINALGDFLRGLAGMLSFLGEGVSGAIQTAAENMENNHDEWMEVCLGTQLQDFIGRTFDETSYVALIADACYAGSLVAEGGLATGFFGGVQNPFVCTDSSMCLREAITVLGSGGGAEAMPAVACVQCPGGRYGCNALVGSGTCACGIQSAQRTPDECSTSAACAGPDAQCIWSDTGDIDGESLSATSCSSARRMGRLPTCVVGGSGGVAVCAALPGNVVSLLVRTDDGPGLARRYMAVLPTYIPDGARVSFADMAVIPVVASLQFDGMSTVELDACEDGVPCQIVAVAPVLRRRLLDWLAAPAHPTLRDAVMPMRRLAAARSAEAGADTRVPNASSWWFVDVDLPPPPFAITELAPVVPCVRTGYIEFDAFLLRAVLRMAGDGWRPKEECGDAESVAGLFLQNMRCDLLTAVVDRLANNSGTLARYFRGNPCFTNMSTSCVQPPRNGARTSNSALWPSFPSFDFTPADTALWHRGDAAEAGFPDGRVRVRLADTGLAAALDVAPTQDGLAHLHNFTPSSAVGMKHYVIAGGHKFWPAAADAASPTAPTASNDGRSASLPVELTQSVVEGVCAILGIRGDFYNNLLSNAVSLEAATNDDEYATLVRRHEFTLGRIFREALTCDFESSVTCAQQNNGILLSFVTMFAFILVLTVLLPLPSVLSFFVWTLGLTVGVVYLAYGYSPFCFPMVPNCLGHGIQELMHSLLPEKLSIPAPLLRATNCKPTGERLPAQSGPCLRGCSELPNPVSDALDVLLVAEALFTNAPNLGSMWQLVARRDEIPSPATLGVGQGLLTQFERCADALGLKPASEAWSPCELELSNEDRAAFLDALDPQQVYEVGGRQWRPRGGLFVAEYIFRGARRSLQSIVLDVGTWRFFEARIERAIQNARASERNAPPQMFEALCFCLALHFFEVLAWFLLALLLLPVFLYSLQYFIVLNILLLQFAIEGLFFSSTTDDDSDDASDATDATDDTDATE